jgi:4'-phosphopantetheinyl transferase
MPLEKIEYQTDRAWGLWRITESEEALLAEVNEHESISDTITHPLKRLEFIAGRVLAKTLVEKIGSSFQGLTKDEFGKPFYKSSNIQLSLSHSYPYVAALADTSKSVGIDVEQIKPKLLRIASRTLHPLELEDAGNEIVKHCVYWCAKESLIKIHGKKDLTLTEQLFINPFKLEISGFISGKIIVNRAETIIPLQYQVFDGFIVVFNI